MDIKNMQKGSIVEGTALMSGLSPEKVVVQCMTADTSGAIFEVSYHGVFLGNASSDKDGTMKWEGK